MHNPYLKKSLTIRIVGKEIEAFVGSGSVNGMIKTL